MSDHTAADTPPGPTDRDRQQLSPQERGMVRAGALGALAMVSRAQEGFFSMFAESVAGARALAAAPPPLGELLTQGGFVAPPSGSAHDVEAWVLGQVSQSVRILGNRSEDLLDGFRSIVVAGCDAIASAANGVGEEEARAIQRVREALEGRHPEAPQAP